MRTTLTLDADIVSRIKKIASKGGRSFTSVLNEVARRGLETPASAPQLAPFRVEPHATGLRAGVDARKLNQLVDDLTADAFTERQAP